MKRNEDSLRDLWDNIKHTNIRMIGVPEGEEREKGSEKIQEKSSTQNKHCRFTITIIQNTKHKPTNSSFTVR